MKFSMETLREIWNDEGGERWEIGPDRDGLDLVEIRQRNELGEIEARMTFPKECGALIAEALWLASA